MGAQGSPMPSGNQKLVHPVQSHRKNKINKIKISNTGQWQKDIRTPSAPQTASYQAKIPEAPTRSADYLNPNPWDASDKKSVPLMPHLTTHPKECLKLPGARHRSTHSDVWQSHSPRGQSYPDGTWGTQNLVGFSLKGFTVISDR